MRNREKADDVKFDENGNPISSDHLYMNGAEIFNFTIEAVPPLIEDTLKKNNLNFDEINTFIFHQANKFMLNYLRKKLKIEESKFPYFMSEVGNTVSSTLPIVMYEEMKKNNLKGNILLAGFGVGYSWGGCIIKIIQ